MKGNGFDYRGTGKPHILSREIAEVGFEPTIFWLWAKRDDQTSPFCNILLLVTSPAAALADTYPSCSRSGKSSVFKGDFSHYQVNQINGSFTQIVAPGVEPDSWEWKSHVLADRPCDRIK